MKIKNEVITIKNGKKTYEFNNLILNEYLSRFIKKQLSEEDVHNADTLTDLSYLLIKFDTPIENITPEKTILNNEFDIVFIFVKSKVQDVGPNQISVKYIYDDSETIFDYNKNTSEGIKIEDYYDRKVAMLAFNGYWTSYNASRIPVCAVLDVSNMNIYLQENQKFSVTRKDIITTDSIFKSSDINKIPGPTHISPLDNKAVITPNKLWNDEHNAAINGEDKSYGILYSIGLGYNESKMDKEFIIGEDVQIDTNNTELIISDITEEFTKYLYYPSSNKYPNNLLYPTKENYKYVIFKYKVWQNILSGTYENPVNAMTDTGYYYLQSIPLDKFGKLNFKIKYERG